MSRTWLVVFGGILVGAAVFGIGYAVGDGTESSAADSGPFDAVRHDRMSVMFGDGSMSRMFRRFETMMSDLREGMSPDQRQRMDRDALWKLMQTGHFDELMGRHSKTLEGMPGMGMGGHGHRARGHGPSMRGDRMAVMFADGSMHQLFDDFEGMMTELRRAMTPEQRQRMDRDAMWKLVRSGDFDELMVGHSTTMAGVPGMYMGMTPDRHGPGGVSP